MCDLAKFGIDGDWRRPYYIKVEAWTQKYANGIGLEGPYGHEFKQVLAPQAIMRNQLRRKRSLNKQPLNATVLLRVPPNATMRNKLRRRRSRNNIRKDKLRETPFSTWSST